MRLFGLMLVSALFILNSCSKDTTTDPVDLTPSLSFVGGTGYVSSDVTLDVNEPFKVGITAFSNTNSSAKLAKLTITRVVNNVPHAQDTTFNSSTLNLTINAVASNLVGQEKWFFKVTDKDNQVKEVSFTITTVAPTGPINAYSMKIMGAQGNTTGSSFASFDGTVYTLTDAKTNAGKIDWLYYNGATNHATIASPKDSSAAVVYNSLKTWSVRNNTLFKKVTNPIVWNDITNDAIIVAQTASGVLNTKITTLQVNDILSFITVTGKKGLLKVESIAGTTDGTITISVKVQQ